MAATADTLYARDAVLTYESLYCLNCHARHGPVKKFQNNESISAYVDADRFRASVHNFLTCSGCHTDFSGDKHPERRFRSKHQYRLKASRICRRCHKDEDIKVKSIHASLLGKEKEGKSPVCTDCHIAHSIMPVSGGKVFATEGKYCMSCHGYEIMAVFKNEESLLLKIDASELKGSAHSRLSCSDCHFGFSSEAHPQRNFRSRRDYTLASSAVCRRCHFDKYTKTTESIHFAMLSKGRLEAPTCVDCHGAHSVQYVSADRTTSAMKCRKCHNREYEMYSKSVHGAALLNEHNKDVPVCIDCHMAHDIRNPLALEYHERIPEMCSNCHADEKIVGKYGLSTDVVKTYLSDFHGVTLRFYRMQKEEIYRPSKPIAVCTDCHGTHNITKTAGPDATVVKANLVKRCRKCHKNATENFPDTWLSHYMPTLSNAPLVFMVNTIYKVLLPVMVVGLFLQILLHIWRYLVSR
jgi:nitrate/TMAO reductase-like tetraheme cytochrome c subunit